MLDPASAYARLLATGPFDDPTLSWYPYRWYLAEDGTLCCGPWRGFPKRFPRFRFEGPVMFGAPLVRAAVGGES